MSFASQLLDLLYPPVCLLCGSRASGGAPLCAACAEALPRSRPPVCDRCGVPLPAQPEPEAVCRRCREASLAFDLARSPWQFAGPMQDAVHAFKYRRRRRLGRWLAEGMAATAKAAFPIDGIDAVVPVPQHWAARHLRGFDPAAELSRAVASALGKPLLPALRRVRRTASQTRLTWEQRQANVRAAFAGRRLPAGSAYLLVDDVLTSGATAHACAAALRASGAGRVFVLTAARTPLAP